MSALNQEDLNRERIYTLEVNQQRLTVKVAITVKQWSLPSPASACSFQYIHTFVPKWSSTKKSQPFFAFFHSLSINGTIEKRWAMSNPMTCQLTGTKKSCFYFLLQFLDKHWFFCQSLNYSFLQEEWVKHSWIGNFQRFETRKSVPIARTPELALWIRWPSQSHDQRKRILFLGIDTCLLLGQLFRLCNLHVQNLWYNL